MYTIILAGGFGTRLFPLSRSTYPKQFIPLIENKSLFQKAVTRALIFSKPEEIYIITNKEHKFLIQNQLLEINVVGCNILLEPVGKNTLPAILYGVKKIFEINEEGTILVLPSDQLLEESERYIHAVKTAEKLVEKYIVTFGIVPSSPNTGYGYIKPGSPILGGYTVASFIEKPDFNSAKKYMESGYLWNAGIFCISAKVFIAECKKYSDNILSAFDIASIDETYRIIPKISIDYGILEKSNNVVVIPLPIAWNDLGSFSALYTTHEKDANGNVVYGEYLSPDGKNNLIITKKLVSSIGLSNIAIIDTPDVLMISPLNMSQNIGVLTELLHIKKDLRVSQHTTVHRPWGTYTTLLHTEGYLIKELTVNPHNMLSLQYHNHRSEHWVVVKGVATVRNGNMHLTVHKGESTFIQIKELHRLSNDTDETLKVIEVQIGDILTEDDIIRLDDKWGRES